MHRWTGPVILVSLIAAAEAAAQGGRKPRPASTVGADRVPDRLRRWLAPQEWRRDTDGPALSLGAPGSFDDTHMFAPSVAVDGGKYLMWYCGSTGTARDLAKVRRPDNRQFELGLAISADGKRFERHGDGPVMTLKPGPRSILTPSILRGADGAVRREDGKLRLWFTSAAFRGKDRTHVIQEATSADGRSWSPVAEPQIEHAYAASVIKLDDTEGAEGGYAMWYTRPGRYPWNMFHARSADGRDWKVDAEPVLRLSQPWEHDLQIYPCVLRVDGVFLMWYASYSRKDHTETAIGFAASADGVTWFKHPQNPVLRPDPERPWESHYVSSQSIVRLADGSFRIWYASRKKPPFDNLYFALNTAVWKGPPAR